MKYQYIKVQSHRTQRELTVLGTDVDALTRVTEFIKEKFGAVASSRDIGNRVYSLTFRSLGKQDEGAAMLVIEMLCQRGWEPFSTDSEFVHLRLMGE